MQTLNKENDVNEIPPPMRGNSICAHLDRALHRYQGKHRAEHNGDNWDPMGVLSFTDYYVASARQASRVAVKFCDSAAKFLADLVAEE